jgi:hypothetical protein
MITSYLLTLVAMVQLTAGLGFLVCGDWARAAIFLGCTAATVGTLFAR